MASNSKGEFHFKPDEFCKYVHRYCNQTRLEGYDYCIRHILEDKSAPFKQCSFVNPKNKIRCSNAASTKKDRKVKKDITLCPFHVKNKEATTKPRTPVPKPSTKPPIIPKGPAGTLKYLEHHCIDNKHDSRYSREIGEAERMRNAPCVGGPLSSLKELEASIDVGEPLVERSAIDSIDDDMAWGEQSTDPLAHAGVYTTKELVRIARQKTMQLQKLYIKELQYLYHQLQENKRKFLASVASGEADQGEFPPEYTPELLEALKKHHRCSRIEKLMRQRYMEKAVVKKSNVKQCKYEKNGSKCTSDAIVLTDYCKNHILNDPKQVLFRPCGYGRDCQKPVIPYQSEASCDMHYHLAMWKYQPPVRKVEKSATVTSSEVHPEQEQFQAIGDIASLGLDAITPEFLLKLDQYGQSTTGAKMSEDLMQIQPMPPEAILNNKI